MNSLVLLHHLRRTLVLALGLGALMPVYVRADGQLNGIIIAARQGLTVNVNGFPLHTGSGSTPSTLTYELNAYLKQGANQIGLAFPRPEVAGGESTVVRFRIEHLVTPDATGTALFQFERTLARPTSTDTAVVLPLSETAVMNGGVVPRRQIDTTLPAAGFSIGEWRIDQAFATQQVREAPDINRDAWSLSMTIPQARLVSLPWDGQPPELNEGDRSAIRALVTQLREAIRTFNQQAIGDLFAVKTQRFAVARAQTEEEVRASLLRGFANAQNTTPAFVFAEMDPAALEFATFPGSALVEAHIAGQPPIRADNGTTRFSKRVFLARIAGQWQIVD
jgi:hypothetical protein